MSVGHRAEKFNVVSNDHGRTQKYDFFILDREYRSWANLVQKIKFCQFELKFGTRNNSNMQKSMMMFTFSISDRKYPFWVNLIPKLKFVCLKWNLLPRLSRIYRIQWWCSLFLFWTRNILFEQIWFKKSKFSV